MTHPHTIDALARGRAVTTEKATQRAAARAAGRPIDAAHADPHVYGTPEWAALPDAELLRLVWSEPARLLCARFGVSDVAIGKRCRKFGIARPPRGFWAKVYAGVLPHPEGVPAG